jgi:hypothetical protein
MAASLVSPVLVGRETESAALDAALARALEGESVTVLVGGVAGVASRGWSASSSPGRERPAPARSSAAASSSAEAGFPMHRSWTCSACWPRSSTTTT